MKNFSCTNKVVAGAVVTAFLVSGLAYAFSTNKISSLQNEISVLKSKSVVDSKKCFAVYKIVRVLNNQHRDIQFEYPCGWNLTNPGADSIVVRSPDGQAEFQYPAPDFDSFDARSVGSSSQKINGKIYPTEAFSSKDGTTIMVVQMGKDLSEYEYKLMTSYSNQIYLADLTHILSSFTF